MPKQTSVQPNKETSKAAQAFHEYCLLEDRSLARLAKRWLLPNGKPAANLRQLEEWSRVHNWQDRVKIYDYERAEEKRRKREAEIDAMNSRHAQIGITQQAKALKQIETLIEAKSFGSQAVVQLLKLATDLERLARGAATERAEVSGVDGGPIKTQQVEIYKVRLPDNERDAHA